MTITRLAEQTGGGMAAIASAVALAAAEEIKAGYDAEFRPVTCRSSDTGHVGVATLLLPSDVGGHTADAIVDGPDAGALLGGHWEVDHGPDAGAVIEGGVYSYPPTGGVLERERTRMDVVEGCIVQPLDDQWHQWPGEVAHVVVTVDGDGRKTRVAVKRDGDALEIMHIGGPAPKASWLYGVISVGLGRGDWWERGEALHRRRETPYRIECRTGMSGATTAFVRIVQCWEMADTPVVSAMHISMANKLNELGRRSRYWLGDLVPLMDALKIGPDAAPEDVGEAERYVRKPLCESDWTMPAGD